MLCQSIFSSKTFQDRFRDKWILVDGYAPDEAALTLSYGFKKCITLKELMSLEVAASPFIGVDL